MNELHSLMSETVAQLMERHCPAEVIEAAEAGTFPSALWGVAAEAGLPLAAAPESAGGLGMGLAEIVHIARSLAYHAAPLPVAETLFANWLWGRARGEAFAPIATVHISADGAGGAARFTAVPWARDAEAVLLVLDDEPGSQLVRIPLHGLPITCRTNLAGEPRDDVAVSTQAASGTEAARLAVPAREILAQFALIRAGQLVGAMERALELAIGYANERSQFGKPIGRFQAIQQQVAVAAELVAASVTLLTAAAGAPPDREPLLWAAKAVASESAGRVAATAHAVHGAMGFTREYGLQFLTRRLWAWREECGNETFWNSRLAARALAQPAHGLWPWLEALSPSRPFPGTDNGPARLD